MGMRPTLNLKGWCFLGEQLLRIEKGTGITGLFSFIYIHIDTSKHVFYEQRFPVLQFMRIHAMLKISGMEYNGNLLPGFWIESPGNRRPKENSDLKSWNIRCYDCNILKDIMLYSTTWICRIKYIGSSFIIRISLSLCYGNISYYIFLTTFSFDDETFWF